MNRNGKVAKITCRAEPFDKSSNTDLNKEGMIDIDDTKAMFKILKRANNLNKNSIIEDDN